MNEFHLLIDDFREFDVDHIAKTAREGLAALAEYPVTHLYLDHDLGDVGEPIAQRGVANLLLGQLADLAFDVSMQLRRRHLL